jgi:catechol 2,3-dioxygenase-like lactoylglutathione lyase family enzyme
LGSTIEKVDSVGIPSTNTSRSRDFYVGTLGLRPDEHADNEFWIGDTCFSIWEPQRFGLDFQPQRNGIALLRVEDVATARRQLEANGVSFVDETVDTGVCHMATFEDPDGNLLVLHRRYASYLKDAAA